MNSGDRAVHLRTNYSVGQGLRQRKWWWSIFLWGLDVAILNAYLIYKAWYKMHGIKPMTHYCFREKIALAWLDEEPFWPSRYARRKRNNSTTSENKKKRISSSLRLTRASAMNSTTSSSTLNKSCKTLNQSRLEGRSFDKRLIPSDEFTHLPAPTLSNH